MSRDGSDGLLRCTVEERYGDELRRNAFGTGNLFVWRGVVIDHFIFYATTNDAHCVPHLLQRLPGRDVHFRRQRSDGNNLSNHAPAKIVTSTEAVLLTPVSPSRCSLSPSPPTCPVRSHRCDLRVPFATHAARSRTMSCHHFTLTCGRVSYPSRTHVPTSHL